MDRPEQTSRLRSPGANDSLAVSVILPVYNGQKFVAEQIRSIFAQTLTPTSIIVADDGSCDQTLHIVEDLRRNNKSIPIKVLPASERPLGVARNVQRSLWQVETPFLALSDQDDIWDPRRLETGVSALISDPSRQLIAGNAAVVDALGAQTGETVYSLVGLSRRERRQLRQSQYIDILLRRNIWPGMTFTMRSSFARMVPTVPDGWMHDYWFALAASGLDALHVVEDAGVNYRLHGKNQIGLSRSGWVMRKLGLVKWLFSKERRTSVRHLERWADFHRSFVGTGLLKDEVLEQVERKVRFENARLATCHSYPLRVRKMLSIDRITSYKSLEQDGAAAYVVDAALAILGRK